MPRSPVETPVELTCDPDQYQIGSAPGIRRGKQSGVMHMYDRSLSEEQKMMRQSCRDFVDDMVLPYIKKNWQKEWSMVPEDRLPLSILEGADKVGIRALGVPEEYGGVELEKGTEVRTFAMIAEEIARGDSGLADKLVQNWKVSVLLRQFAPKHHQEKFFKRLVAEPQFLMAH
jgi:alkylation response protein AidB-like acyl-CoA dehydrogenase